MDQVSTGGRVHVNDVVRDHANDVAFAYSADGDGWLAIVGGFRFEVYPHDYGWQWALLLDPGGVHDLILDEGTAMDLEFAKAQPPLVLESLIAAVRGLP